jgi:hypothetical protein
MLMKRVWGHVLAGMAVLGVGSAAAFACVHNDSSIFIQNVLAGQQVSGGAGCSYTSATTQPFIPFGVLDVLLRNSYDPTYLVGNQLVAEANSSQLMTETSTVTIQGATVRLTDSQGNKVGTGSFTSLTSGTIYPATGGVPSYTPIAVPSVIDSATVAAIVQANAAQLAMNGYVRVITYVRVFGNTLGGRYVESGEFEFPVDICQGCLIAFTQADNNPCYLQPNCLGNPASTTMSANTVPCNPGMDIAIDCAQCTAVNQACRGAYANKQNPTADAGCVP